MICENCDEARKVHGEDTLCLACANHEARWRRDAMGDSGSRMVCSYCRVMSAHNSALINEIARRDREDEARRFNGDKV